MSTRCNIGIVMPDKKVHYVYCHYDGYLDGVGKMILENYTDTEKVNRLISLGDISFLEKEIDTDNPHTFDNPYPGVTVFYGRDRGEDGVETSIVNSLEEYLERSDQSYCYYYSDGHWYERRVGILSLIKD